MRTIIIAEAGINHNGKITIAKKMIDAAVEAGADFVKFQTFKTRALVTKSASKADYQKRNTGNLTDSQFDMLKQLELDQDDHYVLRDYCISKGIQFLSSGFDEESIDLLDKIGIQYFKIPSGEITNKPYLQYIASKGKQVLLSTGMSNMSD